MIAVDRVKERLDLARILGATHSVDTISSDFATMNEAVRAELPTAVSLVIDTTGVPDLIEQGLRSTLARDKLVCIGVPPLGYHLGVNVTEHINVSYSALSSETFPTDSSIERPRGLGLH